MAIDIMNMVEDLVEKIKKDPKMLEKFSKEPVKVLEKLTGLDLPDDDINKLVKLIKAKIDMDKVGDMLGGLGGLFKK